MRDVVYIFFESAEDRDKAVKVTMSLGGIANVSAGFDSNIKMYYVSLLCEHDIRGFLVDLLNEGVKVDSVVQKSVVDGQINYRSVVPLDVKCCRCGSPLLYSTQFSRTGYHLCDRCLSMTIERVDDSE